MDWYYGRGINDFLVPKDEDLLDRAPSPNSWSKWEISEPDDLNSPKTFFMVDTDVKEVDFNFIDESLSEKIELEPSLHDKDHSSCSSVCGGLPEQSSHQTALSCDEPNYQLQELSSFEQIDDIFLYKHQCKLNCSVVFLHSKFRHIYLYDGSQYRLTQSYLWFSELYKHEPVIAWDSVLEGLPCIENLQKSLYLCPENHCSNTHGGLQKDIAASTWVPTWVPCDSKSEDWLDVEAPTVKELDPFEQCSRDEAMHEQLSLEESILQDLETVIAQFNEKTCFCFRDALYRLAQNTKQQVLVENSDGGLYMQKAMPHAVHNETVRSEDKKPMESRTNIVDRAVANLMFNKMEVNLQDLPLTTSFNGQEVIGSKGPEVNGSKDWNPVQKFHYPQPEILQGDAKAPRFAQREQQTSTESHIEYMQIL